MSNPSVSATIVFGLFAFLFIGVMLAAAFVIDRRRVKDVHDAIPERVEGAVAYREEELHRHDHEARTREVHTASEYEAQREHRDVQPDVQPEVHHDMHGDVHGDLHGDVRSDQHRHGAA